MCNRGDSRLMLAMFCPNYSSNASAHKLYKHFQEVLVHMCCTAPIGGVGSCWLCPQCSIQTLVCSFTTYWVCGSDCLHLHSKDTDPIVVGIHLYSHHVKIKEELPVLLLEIGILLNDFLRPYPQLILCLFTFTEALHSCIGHNCQPWQLFCRWICLPSGIPHGVKI